LRVVTVHQAQEFSAATVKQKSLIRHIRAGVAVLNNSKQNWCGSVWNKFHRCRAVMLLRTVAQGVQHNVTRTNWTVRWITNDIEVRMPKNIFVSFTRLD
jgi:hypothetical protein